ncbi:MAG: HEPN domain-containing protein [Methanomassiliicoccaceae archaeon]|nr:HEPN domain-containing protein [Methanomassiliicoccaceae archaeon]
MVQYDDIAALRQRATEDLRVAEIILDHDDELLTQMGFHLQQFLEKRMKVCLQEHNVDYPKTHDLVLLLELFPQEKISDNDRTFAYILSRYAVELRYGIRSAPPLDGRQMLERAKKFAELMETLW